MKFLWQAMNASVLSKIPIKKSTAISLDDDIVEDEEETDTELDDRIDAPDKNKE
jgi:hypothetical protein